MKFSLNAEEVRAFCVEKHKQKVRVGMNDASYDEKF